MSLTLKLSWTKIDMLELSQWQCNRLPHILLALEGCA